MVRLRISKLVQASAVTWLAWCGATLPVQAFHGIIRTTGGTQLEGSIELAPDGFRLTDAQSQSHLVPLAELKRFSASQPKPTPAVIEENGAAPRHGLLGSYFQSAELTGPSRFRVDEALDFNWENGSPMPGLPADRFSVRWEGKILSSAPGNYQFHIASDDGARLWVDGQLIVDQWRDRSVMESTGQLVLQENQSYPLKLEYFENGGQAIVRLLWTAPGQPKAMVPKERLFAPGAPPKAEASRVAPATGWLALYYDRQDLSGPFQAATNATIDFHWRNNRPLAGINHEHFSVRWMGELTVPDTDHYSFHVESDDGMRLWIDGELLLDEWHDGVMNLTTKPVSLEKGRNYTMRYEMFENTSEAKARLFWSSARITKSIVPSRHVHPLPPPVKREETTEPLRQTGVWLAGGTFLAQPVTAFDGNFLRFSRSASDPAIAQADVARIHFQNVPADMLDELRSGRPGLLLKTGDYVDGDMRELRNGRVKLDSVLLGLKTFRLNQVVAAVFREVSPREAQFEIRTEDGSLFRVEQVRLADDRLLFQDPGLRGFFAPAGEITEMRRVQ